MKLSVFLTVKQWGRTKLEFERPWGGNIQGYCGAHIGKQIPKGEDSSKVGKCPSPP